MDKKLYVVRGQHDGNLGIYSNIKRAFEVAINYVGGKGIVSRIIEKDNQRTLKYYNATYTKIIDHFRKHHIEEIFDSESENTLAEIERFYLNN